VLLALLPQGGNGAFLVASLLSEKMILEEKGLIF
jgi:hypothetical protein